MTTVVFRMGEYHRTMVNWWMRHHGNAIDVKLLARFGVAVLEDEHPIAITHLYPTTTADIVWMGFTARDPSISHYKAGKALKLLLTESEDAVRRLGYSVLYTGFDSPALQKLCKRHGFNEGDRMLEQWKEVK